jgi:hypothetical protein
VDQIQLDMAQLVKAQLDKTQSDIAKTNFSVRFGLCASSTPCFVRPDETTLPFLCENRRVSAKTGTNGLFGRNDRKKGSSGNDKIPLGTRPQNATTCGNSIQCERTCE